MSARAGGRDHFAFAGITLAGCVLFDRADRNALVGNVVLFAPGGQMTHEAAVGVCCVDAGVAPDFLEEHGIDFAAVVSYFVEPALETQIAHAATFKASWRKLFGAAGDRSVTLLQCPTRISVLLHDVDEGQLHGARGALLRQLARAAKDDAAVRWYAYGYAKLVGERFELPFNSANIGDLFVKLQKSS